MERVLIISYFFPPCNLPAAQRAQSWANYLPDFGYKPIIVTRRWDEKISHLSDVSKSTPDEIKHEIFDTYEVYHLPYRANFRDEIYVKYKEKNFNVLRKLLTFFELLFQSFLNYVIPYNNIVRFSFQYLRKNPDVKKMVVTGNPFILFKFAYQLHKASGIKWIADYRDAWTTSTINLINKGVIHKLIGFLERYFEKKWISNAELITASSLPIATHVATMVNKYGFALYNGFVAEDFLNFSSNEKFKEFTITYVGTLYDGQKVEIFCEAFKRLIDENPNPLVRLFFPGLNFHENQHKRIKQLMSGYEKYYECVGRMERDRILEIEKKSHLLLHVAWDEHNGIIASKVYEYIASGTFILITPNDNGAIEEIIKKSNCGICTRTVDETYNFLKQEYEGYLKGIVRINDVTGENLLLFSRQKQVGTLAELLDKI